jgi:hypothetical protein
MPHTEHPWKNRNYKKPDGCATLKPQTAPYVLPQEKKKREMREKQTDRKTRERVRIQVSGKASFSFPAG